MGFTITNDITYPVYPGMIITYRVSPLLGIPMTWVSEISHVIEGKLFVDEQRFGPYRFWHHKHLFHPMTSGVIIEDIVDYALPFGPLGDLVHAVLVRRQLKGIFDYRSKVLLKLFSSDSE